jgi:DNA-binding NtrC family response regulator
VAPSGVGSAGPRAAMSGDVVAVPVGATLADAERELIAATLRRYRNRRDTARVLGLGLRTLYTKLRLYRLRPDGSTAETA